MINPYPTHNMTRRSARLAGEKAPAPQELPSKRAKKQKVNGNDDAKPAKPAKAEPKEEIKDEDEEPVEDVKELEVGDELPSGLVLKNQDGEDVDISAVVAKEPTVVIFSYPKASTPGCTRQVCGFRDKHEEFVKHHVTVFGLSADSPQAQKTFKTKQKAPYDLLSDPKHALIGVLGATKTPGKVPKGVIRSHWIFKNGKLAVKEVKIGPEASYTKALEEVEK